MSDMTRKEALEILKYQHSYGQMEQSVHDALGLAIASLKTDEAYQLEYERTTKNDLGVDCISRADAIHAISEALERTFVEHEDIANKLIGNLPSVTPQEPTKDYRRAFKIACELLSGSVLYGIDSDKIFETAMQKDGLVSNESYERYILNHLQELDHGQYAGVEE